MLITKEVQVEQSVLDVLEEVTAFVLAIKKAHSTGGGMPELFVNLEPHIVKVFTMLGEIAQVPADVKNDLVGSMNAVAVCAPKLVAAIVS